MSAERKKLIQFVWMVLAMLVIVAGTRQARAAPPPNQADLSWTTTQQQCDGTIVTGSLVTTRIYYGLKGRVAAGLPAASTGPCADPSQVKDGDPKVAVAYGQTIDVPAATLVRSIVFTVPGKYYFAVQGRGTTGASNLSNEVSKTIVTTPNPPVLSGVSCTPVCDTPPALTLLVGDTSTNLTISWPAVTATTIEVELYTYPVKVGAIAQAKATLAGTATSWSFRPGRAELMYTRMRSCNGTDCSAWVNSFAQGFMYYFRLRPASGGGIE